MFSYAICVKNYLKSTELSKLRGHVSNYERHFQTATTRIPLKHIYKYVRSKSSSVIGPLYIQISV